MIRFAYKDDVSEIRKLWDIAFPEEPDFNDYFFKNIFDYKNALVLIKKNAIVSMAQMMPYDLKGVGKVTYIYGAATDPMYRKQGLMSELLKKSFEIDVEKGRAASILIPANKPLFDFYKGLGYETSFYLNKEIYKAKENIAEIKEADYEDIPKLMELYKGDIVRSEEYWKIQLDMYKALGGKVFLYNNAYAVVSDKAEEVMYSDYEDRELLLNSVCSFLGINEIEITIMGTNIPFGMVKTHKKFDRDIFYMTVKSMLKFFCGFLTMLLMLIIRSNKIADLFAFLFDFFVCIVFKYLSQFVEI